MKSIWILGIFLLVVPKVLTAQTGVNFLNHEINSRPDIFGYEPSKPASKVFREVVNSDVNLGGQNVKIRTYSVNAIHQTMKVTCYYFEENARWVCKMAKFFSVYQVTPNGIGTFGPNSAGMAISLLNYASPKGSNYNEFEIRDNGIAITGNPPWVAWFDPAKQGALEYLYVSKLDDLNLNDPMQSINGAIAFMSGKPSDTSSAINSKKEINGFYSIFY